jgi:catechol 2,3-dioxygenase
MTPFGGFIREFADMNDRAHETLGGGNAPRLTHFGINVIDIDKMVEFYTRVMGLTVSDRGYSTRLQAKLAFLTGDPAEHHQLVMVDSRRPGDKGNVNQISFQLNSLAELRAARDRLAGEAIPVNPISHGNAWSIYFDDPEGNMIEIYVHSPFHTPQPRGDTLDLDLDDAEIARQTEARVKSLPGYQTHAEWSADIAERLGKPRR